MYRSTKGASKARRDQINAEIRNLKELLPLAEADKVRLSYLHIMRGGALGGGWWRLSVTLCPYCRWTTGSSFQCSLLSPQL